MYVCLCVSGLGGIRGGPTMFGEVGVGGVSLGLIVVCCVTRPAVTEKAAIESRVD